MIDYVGETLALRKSLIGLAEATDTLAEQFEDAGESSEARYLHRVIGCLKGSIALVSSMKHYINP